VRPVSLMLLIYTLDFGLVYGANAFISRQVGSEAYGNFAAAISLATLLATAALLGLDGAVFQEIPVLEHKGHHEKARSQAALGLAICATTTLLFIGILINFPGESHPARWSLWIFPFMMLVKYLTKVIAGFDRARLAAVIVRVIVPMTVLVFLVWVSLDQPVGLNDDKAVLATGAGWAVISLFLVLIAGPRYLTWKPQLHSGPRLIQRSLPFGAVALVYICMDHSGVLLLEFLHADEHEVGLFAACIRIASVLLIFLSGVTLQSTSRLAVLAIQGDKDGLRHQISNNLKTLLSASTVTLLLIVAEGELFLSWFGSHFQDAYGPLVLLTFGFALHACLGFSTTLLQIAGQRRLVMIAALLMVLINLGLGWMLIPRYGAWGASIAFTAANALIYPIQVFLVKKHLGVSYTLHS
jgi:O-antigen/teichoic acid export membrane protein